MATYRVDRTYEWNYRNGPQYRGPFPRVPETPLKDFFGIPVRSRVGVSAGILLNSRWILAYSRLGYDLLTYKTVRSAARASYPLPNWTFLEDGTAPRGGETLRTLPGRRTRAGAATAAVSFGMPSMEPEVWTRDARRARAALPRGKALIVSVVASPVPGEGAGELVDDFARLAAMASRAGAHVVEANLSCPNVCTPEGGVYQDPALSREVMSGMRRAAGGVKLVAKAGAFRDRRRLRSFLQAVDGAADGVLLINGVSCRVLDRKGRPAFGRGREVCGVIGRGIIEAGAWNVRQAVSVVRSDRLDLKVMAVGGVLSVEDAETYFDAGAYAVFMGGGPMYDPLLAVHMKERHPEW